MKKETKTISKDKTIELILYRFNCPYCYDENKTLSKLQDFVECGNCERKIEIVD